jgi:hypothetical protein
VSWPKSLFPIMARTTFTKMHQLLPEHDYFARPENQAEFVELVSAAAGPGWSNDKVTSSSKVFKQTFSEVETEASPSGPATFSGTVGQWVGDMHDPAKPDRLSFGHDRNFEGMGYLGNKTDKRIHPAPESAAPTAPAAPAAPAVDESAVASASDAAASAAASHIKSRLAVLAPGHAQRPPSPTAEHAEPATPPTEPATPPTEPTPAGAVDKGKQRQSAHPAEDKGKQPQSAHPADEQAPVFELRRLQRPGEPDKWKEFALKIFDSITGINEGEQFAGPSQPRDPSTTKPEGPLSGDFVPAAAPPAAGLAMPSASASNPRRTQYGTLPLGAGQGAPQHEDEQGASWWAVFCSCFPFRPLTPPPG